MYLSRIGFSSGHRAEMVRQLRQGLYGEHRMIWSLLPRDEQARRDFLYRREDGRERPLYYLLSARPPVTEHPYLRLETKPYAPLLRTGERLGFSLRANAVVTRKFDDRSKRRIRRDIVEAKLDAWKTRSPDPQSRPPNALIRQEAGEEWLQKQGQRHGFRPERIITENHRFHQVTKPGDPNIRRFSSLDFHGWLEVTDHLAFQQALFQGLGRSRGFGCGLLLVRRAML